jgi:hypothetical protein
VVFNGDDGSVGLQRTADRVSLRPVA